MPPLSNNQKRTKEATKKASYIKRKHKRTKEALRKRAERALQQWKSEFKVFENILKSFVENSRRTRSKDENVLLLLAMKAAIRRRIERKDRYISWTSIEEEIAVDFGIDPHHLKNLRCGLIENGEVHVQICNKRGGAAEGAKKAPNTKLTKEVLLAIAKFVDLTHSEGEAVTSRKIRAHVYTEFGGLELHKSTVLRGMKRLGLNWSPIGRAKRTFASYRVHEIKKYLIGLDKYIREMEKGCLLYTSPSPRDRTRSRMPSSA